MCQKASAFFPPRTSTGVSTHLAMTEKEKEIFLTQTKKEQEVLFNQPSPAQKKINDRLLKPRILNDCQYTLSLSIPKQKKDPFKFFP